VSDDWLYAFVYRGHLTKAAIRSVSHRPRPEAESAAAITKRLPFEFLDERLVKRAKEMAVVYSSIAAFENAVREFVEKRLLEEVGEDWWQRCVPEKRRERAESRREEENKIRWHAKRGESLLEYTEIEDLKSIIVTQQTIFLPLVQSIEWAKHILDTVELSRNTIMHSGYLEPEDIERLAMAMRDWLAQIGG
jgi:Swt1-like HEPN